MQLVHRYGPVHVRAHAVRARVLRQRGLRESDGVLPRGAAAGLAALQRVVRPRNRVLPAGLHSLPGGRQIDTVCRQFTMQF
jgi:hypothetical protein